MKRLFILLILSFGFLFTMAPRVFAYEIQIGNSADSRSIVDTRSNFSIVDTNNPANKNGFLTKIDYYAANTNPFRFILVDASNVVKWVSDEITPAASGVYSLDIDSDIPDVQYGWNIGLYFPFTGNIPFEASSSAELAYYTPGNNGLPVVGQPLVIDNSHRRFYSFVAHGFERKAEIVSPEVNEITFRELNLEAFLVDSKENYIQWAVRKGTCAANTNTVLGNVDGLHNTLVMSYADYTYSYSGLFDISGLPGGMYCFIFNPSEAPGETDIRLTREFYIAEGKISGGGQLIEDLGGSPKDNYQISFGGEIWDLGTSYIGEWQINFHNVLDEKLNKARFHTNDIRIVNFFAPTSGTCTVASNFEAYGTLNGESGYKLTVRLGDYYSPGHFTDVSFDTLRIELRNPNNQLIFDTSRDGFEDESTCVGTLRTGLDRGNITISY